MAQASRSNRGLSFLTERNLSRHILALINSPTGCNATTYADGHADRRHPGSALQFDDWNGFCSAAKSVAHNFREAAGTPYDSLLPAAPEKRPMTYSVTQAVEAIA